VRICGQQAFEINKPEPLTSGISQRRVVRLNFVKYYGAEIDDLLSERLATRLSRVQLAVKPPHCGGLRDTIFD
jgi:hypothetical protein